MSDWLEVIIRSVVAFLIFIGISRYFVRKPLGEASQFEFGILTSIAVILAVGSFQLSLPIYTVLSALFIWAGGMILLTFLSMKSRPFRHLIYGKAIPIIKDGKILEDKLKKERITTDELLRKLKMKQAYQVADVEFAELEANGELNVLLKKEHTPITAKMLDQRVKPNKEPRTVMMDGRILDEALASRGLNRQWLEDELAKKNAITENVFLGQVDEYGQLTVDLFDDLLTVPEPTELPLLGASIRKVAAEMIQHSLETEHEQAKAMYEWAAKQIAEVEESISVYLK